MGKKILFAANLDSFFIKFLIPQLKWFKDNGYEIHIATKQEGLQIPYCDKIFNVDFARSFNIKQNIRSLRQMSKIFKEEHYDIVSCHTPFGSATTRLAAKKCRLKNTRIVYMAHGFHFYKGASKLKYFLFYTAEKYLARFTDEIITINLEDYEIAKNKFKTQVSYVAGIGLDTAKFDFEFTSKDKSDVRRSLGLKDTDFVMIYSAEILPRKRQVWLIKALSSFLKENPHVHLLLPGNDSMNGFCQNLSKEMHLDGQIHFLGFRLDVPKLIKASDVAISSSSQEGLPVSIMEAIYVGLPIVATACRGNSDLVENNKNGFIVGANDQNEFINKISYVMNMTDEEKEQFKKYDVGVIEEYLLENVLEKIINIYLKNN